MGVVRGKMETLFRFLIFTCLAFEISGDFRIIHEQKKLCISESNVKVHVERCNSTNQNQQWRWMKNEKLLHVFSGQCLAFNKTSAAHSRRAIISNCSEAPSWTCHGKEGLLEVKDNSLFLKKQGARVIVGRKYPDTWKRIELNKKGELSQVSENLCSKKDCQGAETCVWSTKKTPPPVNSVTHSPQSFLGSSVTSFRTSTKSNNRIMNNLNLNQNVYEVTEKPWISTSTQHFSRTTEQGEMKDFNFICQFRKEIHTKLGQSAKEELTVFSNQRSMFH